MLSRKHRIDKHLFDEVFSNSKVVSRPHIYAKYTSLPDEVSKFAFVVPRSVSAKAVKRNALRRKARSCVESYIDKVKGGMSVIFFLKKESHNASTEQICQDIHAILKEINLL